MGVEISCFSNFACFRCFVCTSVPTIQKKPCLVFATSPTLTRLSYYTILSFQFDGNIFKRTWTSARSQSRETPVHCSCILSFETSFMLQVISDLLTGVSLFRNSKLPQRNLAFWIHIRYQRMHPMHHDPKRSSCRRRFRLGDELNLNEN